MSDTLNTTAVLDPKISEALDYAIWERDRAIANISAYSQGLITRYIKERFPTAVELDLSTAGDDGLEFVNVVGPNGTLIADPDEGDLSCLDSAMVDELVEVLCEPMKAWLSVNPDADPFLNWSLT